MNNDLIQTIQHIYEAFGRGDVPAIADRMSDDLDFGFEVKDSDVPWHRPVRGRAELSRFFGALAENLEFDAFRPLFFVAGDAAVFVHLHLEYRIRKSGRRVEGDQVHLWRFDDRGRVTWMRHFEDTAQVINHWHAR